MANCRSPLDTIQGHLVDLGPMRKKPHGVTILNSVNPASVFGHGKYGNANCIPTIRGFPALALVGVTALSLLSETLASETTVYDGHREMDRKKRPPLVVVHLQILDPTC